VSNYRDDSALSDALGAVILISIVALGIAIAGMTVLSTPPSEKVPAISADITTIGRNIIILHKGGDTLKRSEMQIVVDGQDYTNRFTSSDGSTWSAWSTGDYLNYSVPGNAAAAMPQGVTIYYLGAKSAYIILSMGVPSAVSGSITPVVPNAPVAAFIADKQTGPVPLVVQFTDQSANSPTAWAWDFGDGGSSTAENPSHQYTAPGVYTVRLTATNGAGSDDEIKTSYITAGNGPVALFTANVTSGMTPLTVQFTDQSTGSPVLQYSWDLNNDTLIESTAQNPSFTYTSTGKYTVKENVTNSVGTASAIKVSYITVSPNPAWKCGWGYRKNITIDKTKVSGTLSSFPVLISLASDADLQAHAQSSGNDILFTSSDGTTKIPHEIEKYTSASGALIAWVKVPAVQSSANTTIFMYYGNSSVANQQDVTNVWTNYKAVWHMTEDPSGAAPQMLDSVSNTKDGTTGGAMTSSQQVTGKINGGLNFDGTNDFLNTSYYQTGVTAYSIDTWIKTSATTTILGIVNDRGSDESTRGTGNSITLSLGGTYHGGVNPGAGVVDYGLDSNSIYIGDYSTTTINDNNWHHVVGTWAGSSGSAVTPSQFSIYIDGSPVTMTAVTTGTSPMPPLSGLSGYGSRIAQHEPWATYFPGTLDEIRISPAALSADWIKTEYNNENSPATFSYLNNQEQWTC
jgi:PKD repeat protein